MIVLDTNALLWWINDFGKLSGKARKIIEEEEKKKAIYVSSVSILEIYFLLKKGRLKLDTLPDNWLDQVESLSCLHFVPIDNRIATVSVNLPDFIHKDPADRIIIATALNLGAKLVTSDKKILEYSKVQTIW